VSKPYFWAVPAAVVAMLFVASSGALAQGPAPISGPSAATVAAPKVALLDVNRVFKEHARFKSRIEEMRQEVERAEAWAKGERERINKLGEMLQQLRRGTPDYQAKEEELTKAQTDLAVQIQRQKKLFMENEAKIYYDVYQEVWNATDNICQKWQIDMVMRFNGENADVTRPDSVLAFINKDVVWYSRKLDITDMVLAQVNATAATPGTANRNAAPARPGVQFK